MSKISVTIEFDSLADADFFFQSFNQPSSPKENPRPTVVTSVASPATAIHLESVSHSPAPVPKAVTASPVSQVSSDLEAIPKSVHAEMNEMLKRMPSDAGVVKAKEILAKHGFTRVRDVNDAAKAQAIIADLKTAA
jgi:hypothetical protein